MNNRIKLLIGLILVCLALGGLVRLAHPGPLDVGTGDVARMACWEVASLRWKPWTTIGYGLVSNLYVGPGTVARMAYWDNATGKWKEWNGTTPISWLTAGNWKSFYSNGSGLIQELALGAAGTYYRSAGAAAAPTFSAPLLSDMTGANWSIYATNGAGVFTAITLPAAYYYLQGNGAAAAPTFSNVLRPARIATTSGIDTLNKTHVLDTLFAKSLLPEIPNTEQLGTDANAWNSSWQDTVNALSNAKLWQSAFDYLESKTISTVPTLYFSDSTGGQARDAAYIYYTKAAAQFKVSSPFTGSTKASLIADFNGGSLTIGTSKTTLDSTKLTLAYTGSSVSADTLSGYNGNIHCSPSFGITITTRDTVNSIRENAFDSVKIRSYNAVIKTPGTIAGSDSIKIVDSLKTDSSLTAVAFSTKTTGLISVNKKWPTIKTGVVNPIYIIVIKGGTTSCMKDFIINSQIGFCKGRVF